MRKRILFMILGIAINRDTNWANEAKQKGQAAKPTAFKYYISTMTLV